MELAQIARLSREDGEALTDSEVIKIHKAIEKNIEHFNEYDPQFFIYLSDRYLALMIDKDRADRQQRDKRRGTIKTLILLACVTGAIYGGFKLVMHLTAPTQEEMQAAQVSADLMEDAIQRKELALDYLRRAADVRRGDMAGIESAINNAGIDYGNAFILKCQDYAKGAAVNATFAAPDVSTETLIALRQAINAQCEIYNLKRQ
ncbi:hypothetical protein ACH54D_20665 [Atlantibacter hermannii]|uniref:hypothetical protein n=1 Tax=Atlantibacter hermannii TaxID=565 RepID=UPI003247F414